MLHQLGDEFLARSFVIQDLILPNRDAAVSFANHVLTPVESGITVSALWICPVRKLRDTHPRDVGFGFPMDATRTSEVLATAY